MQATEKIRTIHIYYEEDEALPVIEIESDPAPDDEHPLIGVCCCVLLVVLCIATPLFAVMWGQAYPNVYDTTISRTVVLTLGQQVGFVRLPDDPAGGTSDRQSHRQYRAGRDQGARVDHILQWVIHRAGSASGDQDRGAQRGQCRHCAERDRASSQPHHPAHRGNRLSGSRSGERGQCWQYRRPGHQYRLLQRRDPGAEPRRLQWRPGRARGADAHPGRHRRGASNC